MPTRTLRRRKTKSNAENWRRQIQHRLLAWYQANARQLPWRATRDPYAIWISEIMLQQTQVATALRYYSKFLAAFPTVRALAAAREQKVLRLWEGLGYYRRAHQLHAAAKIIVAQHDSRFPDDLETLRRLPGIGRYTAGAILSIAFDIPAPILEANTIRLLCRLLALRADPTSNPAQKILWKTAEELLPPREVGHFNQALMELGSLICSPRDPQCGQCPLQQLCPTYARNLQDRIPAIRRPPETEQVYEAAVLIHHRGRLLLRKCGPAERWAGLWDFPRFPLNSSLKLRRSSKNKTLASLTEGVFQQTGVSIDEAEHFATLRHSVTRFRITLDCFTASCTDRSVRLSTRAAKNGLNKKRWVKPDELDDYPLSTTGRKLARLWLERASTATG